MDARPDIVVILTDQERAPPPYEDAALAAWRARALPGRRWFAEHGVSFARHYTGSLACVPSRPTLLTGQYPDLHGVTQTDGIRKLADDPRMRWLRPDEVPTLGHWFRAGGYDTHYDGKWHVSHADLLDPRSGAPLATNTRRGEVLADATRAYLEADPLAPFGFSGWVGPEPHGPRLADSGCVRDPLIAERTVRWLTTRYQRRRAGDAAARRPFLLVVSFVNPHDIVLFPAWVVRHRRASQGPPPVAAAPTARQSLADRPDAQRAFRAAYHQAYGPGWAIERLYRRHAAAYRARYYQLHAEVDPAIARVRRAVTEDGSADALLVLTSDHGDLLGAHGGLHQKWFNLYDECTRVPFVIAGIGACATRAATVASMPTSHVDLVPTLLRAGGLDAQALGAELRRTFSEVHPLPGRDLLGVVAGADPPAPDRAVYVSTHDNVLDGASRATLMWRALGLGAIAPPPRPRALTHVTASFEALVVRVPDDQIRGGGDHLWKLVRSFDDPRTWSEPGVRQRVPGRWRDRFRTHALADQWELYDLDADPIEATDRSGDPRCAAVRDHLRARLEAERARAVPARRRPWAYVPEQPDVLELRRTRRVEVAPEQVWSILADFGAISAWAPNVDASSLVGDPPTRVGSIRRVRVGPLRLREQVVTWTPLVELGYRITGLPPIVRSVINTWQLTPRAGTTDVTLVTSIERRRGPGSRLAASLLGAQLGRASAQLLDGLAAFSPRRRAGSA